MDAVSVLRLALKVLAERVILIIGLVMACFLTAWVMYEPSWHRVAALGIFCLLALLVIPRKERKREADQTTE